MAFPYGTQLMTEEAYLALPETMQRVELIDGEMIVPPAPNIRHQEALVSLLIPLIDWRDRTPGAYVGLAPLDVRISPGRIVQPDLFIFLNGLVSKETPINGVPDLVIEVMSELKSYDRLMKRALYAEAGVREYWMVDVDELRIDIVRADGTMTTHTDEATSDVAPGLRIKLGDILR